MTYYMTMTATLELYPNVINLIFTASYMLPVCLSD